MITEVLPGNGVRCCPSRGEKTNLRCRLRAMRLGDQTIIEQIVIAISSSMSDDVERRSRRHWLVFSTAEGRHLDEP